jgi:hypothetical protein
MNRNSPGALAALIALAIVAVVCIAYSAHTTATMHEPQHATPNEPLQ